QQAAVVEGLLHEVEGDRRNKDPGAEGHERSDDPRRRFGEPGHSGTDEERAPADQSPGKGACPFGEVHPSSPTGPCASDRLTRRARGESNAVRLHYRTNPVAEPR